MATLLQLTQRVWLESGRLGAGPTTVVGAIGDQARVVNAVAEAWAELQLRPQRWRWMRKAITPTLTVALHTHTPTALGIGTTYEGWWPEGDFYSPEILDASDLQIARLHWLPYDEFRLTHLVAPTQGLPRDWSEAPNGDLLIGPAPDVGTYKLRIDYKSLPTVLAADADTPDMPEQHHMLLVWMALEQMGMSDEAQNVHSRAIRNRRQRMAFLLTDQAEPIHLDMDPLL